MSIRPERAAGYEGRQKDRAPASPGPGSVIEFIGPCGRVLLDSSFFRRGHGVGDGAREVISRNVLSKWVGPKTPPERGLLWARRPLAAALRQVTLQELEQGDLTWQSWQQGSEEGLFVQEACERVGACLAQRTAFGPGEASGLGRVARRHVSGMEERVLLIWRFVAAADPLPGYVYLIFIFIDFCGPSQRQGG